MTKCGVYKDPEYRKKYRKRNKERHKENLRKWRKSNKESVRGYQLKSLYNLSLEDYENLLLKQDNKCQICEKEKKLVVDHCHNSGKVRGLLCYGCNTSLGQFKDDTSLLRRAITYLERKEYA